MRYWFYEEIIERYMFSDCKIEHFGVNKGLEVDEILVL